MERITFRWAPTARIEHTSTPSTHIHYIPTTPARMGRPIAILDLQCKSAYLCRWKNQVLCREPCYWQMPWMSLLHVCCARNNFQIRYNYSRFAHRLQTDS